MECGWEGVAISGGEGHFVALERSKAGDRRYQVDNGIRRISEVLLEDPAMTDASQHERTERSREDINRAWKNDRVLAGTPHYPFKR